MYFVGLIKSIDTTLHCNETYTLLYKGRFFYIYICIFNLFFA